MKQLIAAILLLMAGNLYAQQADTVTVGTGEHATVGKVHKKRRFSKFIIPAVLISYGVMTHENGPLERLDRSTNIEISEHLGGKIPIDDYSQFAPYAAVYALGLCGVKAKHNFRDRTIVLSTSYMLMGGAVQAIKSTTAIRRPDRSNHKSFPSGHTATAFAGAHVLFREYRDVSPWIGIGGYVVAAGTGALRVFNRKHWISDVVTGAGIGMLSAEAGYMLLPVVHKTFGIGDSRKSLVVAPSIGDGSYGVGLVGTF